MSFRKNFLQSLECLSLVRQVFFLKTTPIIVLTVDTLVKGYDKILHFFFFFIFSYVLKKLPDVMVLNKNMLYSPKKFGWAQTFRRAMLAHWQGLECLLLVRQVFFLKTTLIIIWTVDTLVRGYDKILNSLFLI